MEADTTEEEEEEQYSDEGFEPIDLSTREMPIDLCITNLSGDN